MNTFCAETQMNEVTIK